MTKPVYWWNHVVGWISDKDWSDVESTGWALNSTLEDNVPVWSCWCLLETLQLFKDKTCSKSDVFMIQYWWRVFKNKDVWSKTKPLGGGGGLRCSETSGGGGRCRKSRQVSHLSQSSLNYAVLLTRYLHVIWRLHLTSKKTKTISENSFWVLKTIVDMCKEAGPRPVCGEVIRSEVGWRTERTITNQ